MSANKEEYDREAGLANLTDEERAALADDGDGDDDAAAVQNDVAGDVNDDDDDGDDEGGDGEGDDDGAPAAVDTSDIGAGSGDAPAEADPVAEADDGGDDDGDVAPVVYQATLPDDFDDHVKAIDDAEAEVARKFEAGEIEAPEYVRETRRIAKERGELDRIQVKVEMAAEMSQQAAMHQWQQQVSKFMRQAKKADGVDYLGDESLGAEFDTMVKALANNPAHADKSGAWFLGQAHKAVKAMRGIAGKPDPKPAVTNDGKPASRKPPIDKAPKTLAQVPGGDGPGDVADEFVNLDNLDGDAYETALARLTPAQRQRYLAAV